MERSAVERSEHASESVLEGAFMPFSEAERDCIVTGRMQDPAMCPAGTTSTLGTGTKLQLSWTPC